MAAIGTQASQGAAAMAKIPTGAASNEINEFAKCECCGLSEECTEAYIIRVRDRFQGRWICGLCSEAVKDEVMRSKSRIGNEEALNRHMSFCKEFRSLRPPPNPTEELISAVKHLLLRSLDSPRSSPIRKPPMLQSKSCFSALEG